MKIRSSIVLALVCCALISSCSVQKRSGLNKPPANHRVFPAADWIRLNPSQASTKLSGNPSVLPSALSSIDSLMKKARANGVLIKDGYLVGEWNYGADTTFETQSITKSVTSLLLGLALKEGKIRSIHDKVKAYYPDFSVGPYTDDISFWNLVTATSGIASVRYKENYASPGGMQPGIDSRYHNDHTAELAKALTYIYGESLLEVLRSRVLKKIGGQAEWGTDPSLKSITSADGRELPLMGGYAFTRFSAADLARIGWLYASGGEWNGDQIIDRSFAQQSLSAVKLPVMDHNPARPVPQELKNSRYGLAWRGRVMRNGSILWYMSGNGGQFCVVIPEKGIVLTKINSYKEKPYTGIDQFEQLILQLAY